MSSTEAFLDTFYKHVDQNKDKYIQRLKELVEIPSVSAWPENRQDIVKVCNIVADVILINCVFFGLL